MTIMRYLFVVLIVVALAPRPAIAQSRPIHVNIGGGPTFPFGEVGDRFSTGWGPAIGVTVDQSPHVGFQFEYAYRWMDVKDELDPLGGRISANHQTHQLAFDMIGTVTPPESKVRVYGIGGPGAYYRSANITAYTGTGVVCDPFWYICGAYPVSDVIGSRGGWDFGVNFGGGVGFKIDEAEFFVESRYHYVWGPTIDVPADLPGGPPSTLNADGQYLPLTFGFRF
jgi:hypothetical protein